MQIEIDSAEGGLYEVCGRALVKSGQEDASGSRRALAGALANRDFAMASRLLGNCGEQQAMDLRRSMVEQFGEPAPTGKAEAN